MLGRGFRIAAWIFATAVGAAAQASRPAAPAGATGWWDDLFADRAARLEDVVASPESYRGATLRLAVQWQGAARVAEFFHTKFEPESWLNFVAWPDEAPLWEDQVFRRPHAFFFIPQDHGEAAALRAARPYARFLLRVRVVEVLKGEPWIEVLGATPLPGRMTESSLLRLVKGFQLRGLRRYESAAEEFAAADEGELPAAVRVRALREKAECLEAAGRPAAAASALNKAVEIAPLDREIVSALAALRMRSRLSPAAEKAASSESRPKAASRPASPPPAKRRRDDGG
jgi:hypothetical protein